MFNKLVHVRFMCNAFNWLFKINYMTVHYRILCFTYVKFLNCAKDIKNESAKLCAMCAKNVLTCKRTLRAYVLTCQRTLHAYVLTCQRSLRALILTCRRPVNACVPHGSTGLACLYTDVSTCFASSRTHVPTCIESLASYGLCDHVITCQYALPPQ